MKLLTEDEVDAHWYATGAGAIKGLAAGTLFSVGLFKLGGRRYPKFFNNLTWSIRTAIFISPPTIATTIWAEEASNAFDREMYSNEFDENARKQKLEEYSKWAELPLSQKISGGLINHKYKIILTGWAASMYGSWVIVDRDPIMSKAQKIVQARMYAQFLTVGLLLGSVALSLYDEKAHPEHYDKREKPSWEKVLEEELSREKAEKAHQPYQRTRIYKD